MPGLTSGDRGYYGPHKLLSFHRHQGMGVRQVVRVLLLPLVTCTIRSEYKPWLLPMHKNERVGAAQVVRVALLALRNLLAAPGLELGPEMVELGLPKVVQQRMLQARRP